MKLVLLLTLIAVLVTPLVADSPSLSKEELCALDVENSRQVLELLQVTPEHAPTNNESAQGVYPRILCFAVTYAAQHQTRVRAVAETWGQRCDKLLFFSDVRDTIVVAADTPAERRFEIMQLDIIADHEHLWLRTRAALKYLHTHFRRDYDWFYKCDDDTYVIVENMRNYLKSPEIIQRFNQEPMQMGHRFKLPEGTFNFYVTNEALRSLWHSRYDRLVYNSGGAGYAMNRLYLDKIVEALPEWTCLPDEESGTMPEDAGVSFCMMWHGVYPWNTRDHRGRERWHAFSPEHIFRTWDDPEDWYVKYHLERSLYFCRTEHKDLESFNHKFGLAIGEKILEVDP